MLRDKDGVQPLQVVLNMELSGVKKKDVCHGPEGTGPFRSLLMERIVALFGTFIGTCNSLLRPTES